MRDRVAACCLAVSGAALVTFTVTRWLYVKLDGQRLVKEVERHLTTAK